jgi:phosphatidylserine decarboxylase
MAERAEHIPDVTPDLPPLTWRATLALLGRLPQARLSRALGTLADIEVPRALRGIILGGFARAVGMNLAEAERPLLDYSSINALFVRRLKHGARVWPMRANTIASPVDGVIGQHGRITQGRLLQAKGRDYSAAELLGDAVAAARFEGGTFITIYLSPRHYHRIHAPCSGTIPSARHIPGALLPVNEPAVLHVPHLFPRNERLVCDIDGALGRTAVVAVGAYNVGRISTTFDPHWVGEGRSVANRRDAREQLRRYDPALTVQQGEELMAFHLGSTIVLLCEPGARSVAGEPGSEVRLGAVLLEQP